MSEHIVNTFGIVQDFADLHGDMSTPLYQAIMDVMVSRQREEIVRCRDCKHYCESTVDEADDGETSWCEPSWCMYWEHEWLRDDGFCAWGERRD